MNDAFLRQLWGYGSTSDDSASVADSNATSAIALNETQHGKQRMDERQVTKRQLQRTVKYGVKTPAENGRFKHEYAGVVQITDGHSTTCITCWKDSTRSANNYIHNKQENHRNDHREHPHKKYLELIPGTYEECAARTSQEHPGDGLWRFEGRRRSFEVEFRKSDFYPAQQDIQHLGGKGTRVIQSGLVIVPGWFGHGSQFTFDVESDQWEESDFQTQRTTIWKRKAATASGSMDMDIESSLPQHIAPAPAPAPVPAPAPALADNGTGTTVIVQLNCTEHRIVLGDSPATANIAYDIAQFLEEDTGIPAWRFNLYTSDGSNIMMSGEPFPERLRNSTITLHCVLDPDFDQSAWFGVRLKSWAVQSRAHLSVMQCVMDNGRTDPYVIGEDEIDVRLPRGGTVEQMVKLITLATRISKRLIRVDMHQIPPPPSLVDMDSEGSWQRWGDVLQQRDQLIVVNQAEWGKKTFPSPSLY